MNMELIYLNKVYDIKHCIYCGAGGFSDFNEVLKHVAKEHRDEDLHDDKQ